MKHYFILLYFLLLIPFSGKSQCDATVPTYTVDLTGYPDSTWVLLESDADDRAGSCCSSASNENCIQFILTLDPNSAGLFFDYDGAGAYGSLAWQIGCGSTFNLKDTICITGVGPHILTFCKPGSDGGNYFIQSVPKPIFPSSQAVPMGCDRPLEVLGVTGTSVTWNSVYPGASGDYNHLLDCIDCLTPTFTTENGMPDSIKYEVCGYPLLDYCVGAFEYCDTVLFSIQDSIKLILDDYSPTFCSGGTAEVNAQATGGDGSYVFLWYDNSLNLLHTGNSFTTSVPGTYTCEVRDGNYSKGTCITIAKTFSVEETLPPIVEPGIDQVYCASSPTISLSGDVTYASGGIWSGGDGFFTPSNTDLFADYIPTSNELENGSVTLVLTSVGPGAGCVNNSDEITFFFADTIKTDISNQELLCAEDSVLIDPVVTGGVGNYIYGWSNGETDSLATLGVGNWCLSITDDIGCTYSQCIDILAPDPLNILLSVTDVSSNGGSNGQVEATVSGGMTPYDFDWSNGGASNLITSLTYGIYSVEVTDDNGCLISGSTVVNEPRCAGFTGITSSTPLLCYQDNSGTATIDLSGGASPFLFNWNDAGVQTSQIATGLASGVYTVEVEDANNCFLVETVVVVEPDPIMVTTSQTNVSILNGSDGEISLVVSGGVPSYNYSWSNGNTSANNTSLSEGWYTYLVTDDNSCALVDSVYISEPPCNEFSLYTGTSSPLCFGGNDGDANLIINNGVGPYSISWSTGDLDVLYVDTLTAGIYTVEVEDGRGCYAFHSFGIMDPTELTAGISSTNISCWGAGDGTMDLMVIGGTGSPYSYSWSNGGIAEDQINLKPGNYTVIITDQNGCSVNVSSTISEPNTLTYSYAVTPVSCYGGSDGAINIMVSGGTLPYAFNWSNGAISEDLTGIDVGGYILQLTDGNSCAPTKDIIVTVTEPSPVIIDNVLVNCPIPGDQLAEVNYQVIGGTGSYQISHDGGITFGSAGSYVENLNVDSSYQIVGKDQNGCLSIDTYTLEIDSNVSIADIYYNECFYDGQTTELVTVVPSGGSLTDYQVSFNNGISYTSLGVLDEILSISTTYQVRVRDEKGCLSEMETIQLPEVFSGTMTNVSDYNGFEISCFGANDGSATYAPLGGTAPYSFQWNSGSTTNLIIAQSQGWHYVDVLDDKGCLLKDSVQFSEPAPFTSSLSITSNYNGEDVSCHGASDGTIESTVSNGVGVLGYSWSNGGSGAILAGVGAGFYEVIITDENACETSSSITLVEPQMLGSSVTVLTDNNGYSLACFGDGNGEALATISGGVIPYSYSWSNGDLSQGATGLDAGWHYITAADVNGCTLLDSVEITQPTALQSVTSVLSNFNGQDISCYGSSDGKAQVSISGGVPVYTYTWSTGSVTNQIVGQSAGTYDVEVTDANGCIIQDNVVISEPPIMSSNTTVTSDYNGVDISCVGYTDGTAEITVSGGTLPYSYSWSDGQSTSQATNLNNFKYYISVSDINGCSILDSITLVDPPFLSVVASVISNYNGFDISCYGDANGVVKAVPTGGVGGYTYTWNNGVTTATNTGLSVGVYTVSIQDANGCPASNTVNVSSPDSVWVEAVITDVSCNGGNDGYIDVTTFGGTGIYTYNWSNGTMTEDATNLMAGTYEVTATDENGCQAELNNLIVDPTALILSTQVVNVSCYGFHDGIVNLTAQGGTPPYEYAWSTGGIGEDIYNLGIGTYWVTVTDANNCFTIISDIVTQPDSLMLTYSVDSVLCYGQSNGGVDVTVTGGTQPYAYLWNNNEITEDIIDLPVGQYNLEIIDSQGCRLEDSMIVEQPDSLYFILESPAYFHGYNISHYGESDGEISVEIYGGTTPYFLEWSTNEITYIIEDLSADTYSLLVQDMNGCEYYQEIKLTEPDDLAMPTGLTPNGDGRNDSYFIRGIDAYPNNKISVFNRWGSLVYEEENYLNTWQGTSIGGGELPDGTYYIILEIPTDVIEKTSYIDLRR